MVCVCTTLVRRRVRVREILGSTPVKGCKYEKLLTFAMSSVKNISKVLPSKWRDLSALQWHKWQHKAAAFSMQHTIQQPGSHSSRCKFSTYQSTPLHSIPASISTDDCTPLDVNLNPLSGKGMFSEFKSKGWMAEAWSPNVCAWHKTTMPGVHNLPSRPGWVAGVLWWFPTKVQ